MVLKGQEGSQPGFTIPVFGGPIQTTHGAALRIAATIADKDGNVLGDLEGVCEKAVAAWETEFKKVGLTLK
jgi:hypothetical protein